MNSIENQVVSRVYGNGRGWAFSKIDFVDVGATSAIEQALSRLTRKNTIRRVLRGLYDYPKYSKLLDQAMGPDIDQVAQAIARKNGWQIEVSGNTALNLLGLSTQLPGKFVYLNDSGAKTYQIGKQELVFKKSRLKDIGFKHAHTALVVQALRELGQNKISSEQRAKIYKHFDPVVGKLILRDARYTTSWIYEEIKTIFKEE
mgnify:CR=1 FL=1